jgi:flagellar biosynthesis protein FliP
MILTVIAAAALLASLMPTAAVAQTGLQAFTMATQDDGGQTYTLSIQFMALMTALTLLPAAVLMMTSFTRIIIVLAILRQALGTMNTPSNQVLLGLALFLSMFIMMPVIDRINADAVQPYVEETIDAQVAMDRAKAPLRKFMLAHIRESDLLLFTNLSGKGALESRETVPFSLLLPAFVTSELKTAFQIGFLIFIPFLVIDLVVASVLMGMGMVMLSPMVISFPFKIMLFVLVDGWALVIGTLAGSFIVT